MIVPEIVIPQPEEVFNKKYRAFIEGKPETIKPLILFEGGRGSGKSRACVQALLVWGMASKIRIALVRKVFDTIRDSSYREIQDCVADWGIEHLFTFTSSPLSIRCVNGTEFICKGLDKVEKTKSLANVDILWIEEANEITYNDYITLSLTIRGMSESVRQKILTFNREEGAWTEKLFFKEDGTYKEQKDTFHLHTTFLDNKFLNDEFIRELESLKLQDIELYNKHALGMPVKLRGLIYPNWKIEKIPQGMEPIGYGVDFGFTNPSTCVACYIEGKNLYLDEVIYHSNLVNSELIELMDKRLPEGSPDVVADSAEADRISEIEKYKRIKGGRFIIFGADKGKNSVKDGIDLVKRFNIFVTPRSTNLQKEFANYKWKEDRSGTAVDGMPVKLFDHGMDAVRYFVSHRMKLVHAAVAGAKKKEDGKSGKSKTVFRYEPVTGRRPTTF
ncbi:MAG: PBSX family phage terminase large subunit [Thermoplasmata archaeon]|nr:PBSX family phage terminase large subunit [Thermoplasmata archaeon]